MDRVQSRKTSTQVTLWRVLRAASSGIINTGGEQQRNQLHTIPPTPMAHQPLHTSSSTLLPPPPTTNTTPTSPPSPTRPTSRRADLTPPPTTTPLSPRIRHASTALNEAFKSEADQPTLFPPTAHLYRTPSPRSISRPRTSGTPSTGSSSPHLSPSPQRCSIDSQRTPSTSGREEGRQRASTPEHSPPSDDRLRAGYSPMSAGFARLNARDAGGSGRRGGSIDLGARMFAGPA